MPEDQSSPPACALHPGATFHKNGRTKAGKQKYRCAACHLENDRTVVARVAAHWQRHKAPRKRTVEGAIAEKERKAAYIRGRYAADPEFRAKQKARLKSDELPP